MTIPRNRRTQPGAETPFIELLFVAVGSLAMLMLIFLAALARPPPPPSCETATPDAEARVAGEIKNWFAAMRERADTAEQLVHAHCPAAATAAPEASTAPAVMPAELARYCRVDQERILEKSGITRDDLRSLGQRYQTASAASSDCLDRQLVGPRGCETPSREQVASAAGILKAWLMATQQEIEAANQQIQHRCPTRTSSPINVIPAVLSQDLAKYCGPDQDRIIGEAGTGRAEIQALAQKQAEARSAALACLGVQPIVTAASLCPSLADAEAAKLANQVRDWWNREQAAENSLKNAANRLCGDPQAIAPDRLATADTNAEPPMLRGYCAGEADQVLQKAGLNRDILTRMGGERRTISMAIAKCGQGPESIDLDSNKLRFDKCKTELFSVDLNYFTDKAREVWRKLGSHNRIDILGHADPALIGAGGCQGISVKVNGKVLVDLSGKPLGYTVYTNEMLSWLRANAVRDVFMNAIDSDETLTEFKARLEDKTVRVYTIAVGASEVKDTYSESRRVEIRLSTDAWSAPSGQP